MPQRRRDAEAALEALQPLRGQRDLRQQHQRLPARRAGCGDRLEIDLGLARAGDAVEQRDAEKRALRPPVAQRRRRRWPGRATAPGPDAPGRARERAAAMRQRSAAISSRASAMPRTTPAPTPGGPRQLGAASARSVAPAPRARGAARRRLSGVIRGRRCRRARQPICGAGRLERRRHAHRHAQHGAGRRQRVGRDPVDEAAQRRRPSAAPAAPRRSARSLRSGRDLARRLGAPHHADHLAAGRAAPARSRPGASAMIRAARCNRRRPARGSGSSTRHASLTTCLSHRIPVRDDAAASAIWLRDGIASNCLASGDPHHWHRSLCHEVLRRYRRHRRDQGSLAASGPARRRHHQPLADRQVRPQDART